MLLQLELSNLATFEKARCEWLPGLNILSGMSGAGKSVLLGALKLSMGGRFSQRWLREGSDEAEVRALYALPEDLSKRYAEALGEDVEEILIKRVFKREGRTSNYINDKMVSLDLLKRLGGDLAKILSQDEAMGLRDAEEQRRLLDTYAGIRADVETFSKDVAEWQRLGQSIEDLKAKMSEASQREQFVKFQLSELDALNLEAGEFERLEEDLKLLGSSAELEGAVRVLSAAADEFLSQADGAMETLQDLVADVDAWKDLLSEGFALKVNLEEWSRALRYQGDELDSDESRLMEVEQRVIQLRSAFKKFGMDETALLQHVEALRVEIDGPPVEVELGRMQEDWSKMEKALRKRALAFHQVRLKVAKALSKEVNETLASLEMPGERFSIECEQVDLQRSGVTDVCFMLKPTADGAPNPLHEAASGGERSRALLAICSALRGSMGCPLLVFDEIDTNIGSRLGKPISQAFRNLSRQAQVICVTHLAPVAASGDRHFVVDKGERTSEVTALGERERISELAHMIAGEKDSARALEQAEEMILQYRQA